MHLEGGNHHPIENICKLKLVFKIVILKKKILARMVSLCTLEMSFLSLANQDPGEIPTFGTFLVTSFHFGLCFTMFTENWLF